MHIVDERGNRSTSYRLHQASILDISVDLNTDFVSTASMDGKPRFSHARSPISCEHLKPKVWSSFAASLRPRRTRSTTSGPCEPSAWSPTSQSDPPEQSFAEVWLGPLVCKRKAGWGIKRRSSMPEKARSTRFDGTAGSLHGSMTL